MWPPSNDPYMGLILRNGVSDPDGPWIKHKGNGHDYSNPALSVEGVDHASKKIA